MRFVSHMNPFNGRGFSFWMVVLVVGWFFVTDMLHHKWMKDEPPNRGVIKHDVMGYYGYLPAIFIYGDHTLAFAGEPGFTNQNRFLYIHLESGERLIQYTSGLSILYAPFFLVAHATAPLLGEERDGYNWVYQFFLVMSALFYVAIGLFSLRKLLLRYFDDIVTAVVLVLVALGTNLYYYTVFEGPMSHSYSFALISVFLLMVQRWYEHPSAGRTMLTGLMYGMIVLVRPTNAIVVVLLVLWGVTGFRDFRERLVFLFRNYALILLMVTMAIIPWIPQLLYWKSVTGQFLYNSYDEVGSAFYFDAPQTHKMLFSYRKGWFIYTPVMLVAFTGFIVLFRRARELFWSAFIYMVVMIYVLSSWWAWWFGGGFGSRSMVDTYAVMAFPLAGLISWVKEKNLFSTRIMAIGLFSVLLALQFLQTAQYNRGNIHYVAMDKDAYWHHFFKLKQRGHWAYLSEPDHTLARLGIYYYYDWGADYDAFREKQPGVAKAEIRDELTASPKMMRSIQRHARRHEMSAKEALDMVVERIYEMKSQRKNLE
jgi:hypothetical protein